MKKIALAILMLCFSLSIFCQGVPILTFTNTGITGLSSPLDIVNAGDGTNRIFIVERGGVIKVYDAGFNLLNGNFLTLTGNFTSGGERGLLSLAFHPDYENNGYFFIYYTNGSGGVNIDRFQTLSTDANQADAATRTNIISIAKPGPTIFTNHNGGKLNFGPDGNLYFGLGDAGSSGDPNNLSQNGNSLWGKMIRINVDNFTTAPYHTVPVDNPFIADPLVSDSIYNIGLRNPWRWSFDRLNGAMWIGDVGQNAREEINSVPYSSTSGVNYGWRCYEGLQPFNTAGCQPQSNYQSPVFEYVRSNLTGGFSVTGGYVYRGSTYPLLYGYYICADYVSNNGWLIKETTPNNFTATLQAGLPSNISGFGETESGELLALSLNGQAFTIAALSTLPNYFMNFNATASTGYINITWAMANNALFTTFEVEHSTDGVQFVNVASFPNDFSNVYQYRHYNTISSRNYYRIKAKASDGIYKYSDVRLVRATKATFVDVITASSSTIQLQLAQPTKKLQLFTNVGQLVKELDVLNRQGILNWPVQLQAGLYYIKAIAASTTSTITIVVN